jgi:hypothetical protein
MKYRIHESQPIMHYGMGVTESSSAVTLLHGRGSTAQAMIPIAETLNMTGLSFLLPQKAQNRWYPNLAFEPINSNELDLRSPLNTIDQY